VPYISHLIAVKAGWSGKPGGKRKRGDRALLQTMHRGTQAKTYEQHRGRLGVEGGRHRARLATTTSEGPQRRQTGALAAAQNALFWPSLERKHRELATGDGSRQGPHARDMVLARRPPRPKNSWDRFQGRPRRQRWYLLR